MKTLINFFGISLVLFFLSCSNSIDDFQTTRDDVQVSRDGSNIINVSANEIMNFDKEFENEFGIYDLNVDQQRDIFINISESKLYIPVNSGFSVIENSTLNSGDPKIKIKEIHGGIKFTIARKDPREDPSKCQGNCKCGVGFRCGSTKSVTIKTSDRINFNTDNREAVAKHYLDFENNYYVLEFVTIIDWNLLNNE
jgi:hypothetical protein